MTIKEVETLTGISSQNIRFYEKRQLISPRRNPNNEYREYGEAEVRKLKIIKMLRLLDIPIEEISKLLNNETELSASLKEQQKNLEEKMLNMKTVITFCKDLEKSNVTIQDMDVDHYLHVMEKDKKEFFSEWLKDYKEVVDYEHQQVFTFMPDGQVTDRYEFCNALYAYAMETNKEVVITKESMYPEFILGGVEYTAQRNYTNVYGMPVAIITCTRKEPSEMIDNKDKRKNIIMRSIRWKIVFFVNWLTGQSMA